MTEKVNPVSKPDYIRNHMLTPDYILAEQLDVTRFYVWICKEVKRNPDLKAANGKDSSVPASEIIEQGLLPVKDAARDSKLSRETIIRAIHKDDIKARKVSGVWGVEPNSWEEFLEERIPEYIEKDGWFRATELPVKTAKAQKKAREGKYESVKVKRGYQDLLYIKRDSIPEEDFETTGQTTEQD